MNALGQTFARFLIPVAIVGTGVGINAALSSLKRPAESKPASDAGVVVSTEKVHIRKELVTVAAQGTVVPARQIGLQPEVQGRVIFRADALVPGGTFKKGDLLLRVDEREYALRAQQSAQEVAQAEQQLKLEQSRGEVAAHEWNLIGESEASDAGRDVALRKPQMKEAEARIALAQSARDLAQLNVGRTTLRAPFNGMMRSGQVHVGQYVSPAMQLGELVGTDQYWVQVSVPVERLGDIQVPGLNAKEGEGSRVTVWQELGEERIERSGRVTRLYGDVDPMGRMSRVLVEIDDPLSLNKPEAERGLPLLIGAYVHVDIEGHEMEDVVEVPRAAVHAGRYVYLYGSEDRLRVQEVEIGWRKPSTFLIRKGLQAGDEIIVSRLGTPVDGLKLRRVEDKAIAPQSNAGAAPAKSGAQEPSGVKTSVSAQGAQP